MKRERSKEKRGREGAEKKLEKEGREQERSNKREGEETRWGKQRVTERKCNCHILPHVAHACVRLD